MVNRHGEFQRHLLSFQPWSQSTLITSSKCPPALNNPQAPQDQSIILIFRCPTTLIQSLPSSSALLLSSFSASICFQGRKEKIKCRTVKGLCGINYPSCLRLPLIPSFVLSICSVAHPLLVPLLCLTLCLSFLAPSLSGAWGALSTLSPSCQIISMQICIAWFASQIGSLVPPLFLLCFFSMLFFFCSYFNRQIEGHPKLISVPPVPSTSSLHMHGVW